MVESYLSDLSLLMLESVCLHSGYQTNGEDGEAVYLGEEGEACNLSGEGGEGEAVNLGGESEACNLTGEGGEGEHVNLGGEEVDDNLGGEEVDDNLVWEGEHFSAYKSKKQPTKLFSNKKRDSSSSQLPPLSGHKRPYSSASFAAATGENRRPATGFGVYSNPTTGAHVFN
uniref:Uncharacterized protein n=1 Tax=Solanum lycopersicum TaxID=4081 RepID=A0A3Q7J7R8_SOLLC